VLEDFHQSAGPVVFRIQESLTQESLPMPHRCAILDDYQNVATKLADWSIPDVETKVFTSRRRPESRGSRRSRVFRSSA